MLIKHNNNVYLFLTKVSDGTTHIDRLFLFLSDCESILLLDGTKASLDGTK